MKVCGLQSHVPSYRLRLTVLAALGVLALLAVEVGMVSTASADSLSTPQMSITASTSTIVGLQVFANVNLTGGANPTGTVTFKLFAPSDLTCINQIFTSTVAVNGTSINADRFTTTVAGTYRWQATYNGDANNVAVGPTACNSSSAAVVVGRRDVGLSVTAQPPASGSIRASAGLGGFAPTGTIRFYLFAPGDTFCSGSSLTTSTAPVVGTGSYLSDPYTATVSGTYKWRADYSGDVNNFPGLMTSCLDPNAAVTVSLGTSPVAAVNPTAISFGQQTVGTTSAMHSVSVSNSGTAGLVIASVNVIGANPNDFRAIGSCTGTTIAPGASCILSITYSPTVAGSSSATLSITDNAVPNNQSVSLSGQGAPRARLTYPIDGQTNVDAGHLFTWSTNPAAQGYMIAVGTTFGGIDLGLSGVLPPSQTSYKQAALPSGTLYTVLYTVINGVWSADVVSFTAIPSEARLTAPTNGQTNVDRTTTFSWTPVSGAQGYYLTIGTTWTGFDLVDSRSLPSTQSSYLVSGLPVGTLYAVLYTLNNGVWTYQSISFTTKGAAGAAMAPADQPPVPLLNSLGADGVPSPPEPVPAS